MLEDNNRTISSYDIKNRARIWIAPHRDKRDPSERKQNRSDVYTKLKRRRTGLTEVT